MATPPAARSGNAGGVVDGPLVGSATPVSGPGWHSAAEVDRRDAVMRQPPAAGVQIGVGGATEVRLADDDPDNPAVRVQLDHTPVRVRCPAWEGWGGSRVAGRSGLPPHGRAGLPRCVVGPGVIGVADVGGHPADGPAWRFRGRVHDALLC